MKKQKKQKVAIHYDLSDFSITRNIRQAFRNNLIPVGNFDEGPGWVNLFILLLIHRLPLWGYWLIMFFEKQTLFLYAKLTNLLFVTEKKSIKQD